MFHLLSHLSGSTMQLFTVFNLSNKLNFGTGTYDLFEIFRAHWWKLFFSLFFKMTNNSKNNTIYHFHSIASFNFIKRIGVQVDWKDLKVTGFKDAVILDQVTGSTRPGELMAIMGSSGAGKSEVYNLNRYFLTIFFLNICYENLRVCNRLSLLRYFLASLWDDAPCASKHWSPRSV